MFAAEPPPRFVPLLREIAAGLRPESLRAQLDVMAETDQRDLLPRIAVPTLLIWGECDVRSPLAVARQFELAIPDAEGRSALERRLTIAGYAVQRDESTVRAADEDGNIVVVRE